MDIAAANGFRIPVLGLFDCDPDGLEIFRCYHSGSQTSIHEARCGIPDMKWLGVDMCDLICVTQVMNESVSMTRRDRDRARAMLKRIKRCDMAGQGTEMRRQLQTMLMLGKKMEIQAVDRVEGGLCGWLERRIAGLC